MDAPCSFREPGQLSAEVPQCAVRGRFPRDSVVTFQYGCFEVYFFIWLEKLCFVKNNHRTSLICNMFILHQIKKNTLYPQSERQSF